MKIGILTYHSVCNFGANLQTLSTIKYLQNNGFEPIVIDWVTEELDNKYKRKTQKVQYREHFIFRSLYFPLSRRCITESDVASVIEEEKIEGVIVGSDAVVQHHPFLSRIVFPSRRIISFKPAEIDTTSINPFWGNFYDLLSNKVPMVMMSVSCQNTSYKLIPKTEKDILYKLISNFKYISTRDDWTSNMFKYLTRGNLIPDITPDPVFAFNQNVHDQPSKQELLAKYNIPENYLLVSFFSNSKVSMEWLMRFKTLALNSKLHCVALPLPDDKGINHPFDYEIPLPLSPLDWYGLLKYSKGYIGNNMHPIVVCLHNAVPCFSFDQYGIVKFHIFVNEKTSKVYHIMKHFGVLQNRISQATRFRRKYISPEDVLLNILNFDIKSVQNISEIYSRDYFNMMEKILTVLKNNSYKLLD